MPESWERRERSQKFRLLWTACCGGLIRDGYPVTEGFKIADIDPRQEEYDNCFTISDKARCIAGGVLEGIFISGGAGGKEMIYLDSAATSFLPAP